MAREPANVSWFQQNGTRHTLQTIDACDGGTERHSEGKAEISSGVIDSPLGRGSPAYRNAKSVFGTRSQIVDVTIRP
jgi:hypothetical protein